MRPATRLGSSPSGRRRNWTRVVAVTLALTKMNWNGTQFDGALPITLKAARQVGDILKYVPDGTTPDPRYRFNM